MLTSLVEVFSLRNLDRLLELSRRFWFFYPKETYNDEDSIEVMRMSRQFNL